MASSFRKEDIEKFFMSSGRHRDVVKKDGRPMFHWNRVPILLGTAEEEETPAALEVVDTGVAEANLSSLLHFLTGSCS